MNDMACDAHGLAYHWAEPSTPSLKGQAPLDGPVEGQGQVAKLGRSSTSPERMMRRNQAWSVRWPHNLEQLPEPSALKRRPCQELAPGLRFQASSQEWQGSKKDLAPCSLSPWPPAQLGSPRAFLSCLQSPESGWEPGGRGSPQNSPLPPAS